MQVCMNPKRGGARKVTREIADFIRKKHEEGLASRDINNLVRENYGVDLHPVTITRYYRPWHEIIERYKEMAREQKRTRYDRIYHRYYRHLDRYLSELFSTSDILSLEEISFRLKKITSIEFKQETLKKKIQNYHKKGRKPLLEEIEAQVYRIKK